MKLEDAYPALAFEGLFPSHRPHKLPWRRVAFRVPLKGEYYVSGAIPMAYRAPNDLTTPYLVVVPVTPPITLKGKRT